MKNKNYLFYAVCIAIFCLTWLGLGTLYAENGDITYGEYLIMIAKSLKLDYLVSENATVNDYVEILKKSGMKIPEGVDVKKNITKEEKAYLLFQAHNLKKENEEGIQKGVDIFSDRGVVLELYGGVFVQRKDENKWIEAQKGMAIAQGDTIKTESGARVVLKVGISGRVEIKENSNLVLEKIMTQKENLTENVLLYLARGEMTVDARGVKEGSTFETYTPTTIAAVRGTIYIIKVDEKNNRTEIIENIKK